jgi:hypothetical protein
MIHSLSTLTKSVLTCSAAVGLCWTWAPSDAQDNVTQARARFAHVRDTLGGASVVDAVTSLSLQGTLRIRNEWYQKRPGANQEFMDYSFETLLLLPNHYQDIKQRNGTTQYSGFAGDQLLDGVVVPAGGPPPMSVYPPDMILSERQDCALLVLALLTRTDTPHSFSLTSIRGDTLTFQSGKGAQTLLDLDPNTSFPAVIRWGSPTPTNSMQLSDYRQIDKLFIPHKLVTLRKGVVYTERQLVRVELNPPLTPEGFAK